MLQIESYHEDADYSCTSEMTDLKTAGSSSLDRFSSRTTASADSSSDVNNVTIISIDDAIDRLGMGSFQHRIMLAAGLCFAADAMEILLLSFLSLVLKDEWDLSDHQASSITSTVFAGAFLGTLTLGRLSDLLGRRPVFIFTASMISLFGMATAAAQTFHQLIYFRFMIGFMTGGIVVPFDILSELMPTQQRGQRLVVTSYFWTCATMLVPILAYFTLGQGQTEQDEQSTTFISSTQDGPNWRLFVACCAIPCLVSTVVGIYVVPESPRWFLTRKGDTIRALDVLRKAAVVNGKDPYLLFPAGIQLEIPAEGSGKATFWDLLSPEWIRTTLLLWCVWASYAFLYYGTIIAVTLVFSGRNTDELSDSNPIDLISSNETTTTTTYTSAQHYHFDYLAMVVSSSAEIAGVTWVLFTVDRFGRIYCQMAYFLTGGILMLTLCMLQSTYYHNPSTSHRLGMVMLAFLTRMFVYSGSAIVWIVTAELLTTEIRATGHSVANAVARIGAFSAPYVVSPSTPTSLIGITMFLISIFNVICTWHLPETAGKPLGNRAPSRGGGAGRIRVPTQDIT